MPPLLQVKAAMAMIIMINLPRILQKTILIMKILKFRKKNTIGMKKHRLRRNRSTLTIMMTRLTFGIFLW